MNPTIAKVPRLDLPNQTLSQTLDWAPVLLIVFLAACVSPDHTVVPEEVVPQLVGGPCEGCEAIFEYGDRELSAVDTLSDFNGQGLKIKITGTVYQNNGTTPAEDVILYIYHTDQNGLYPTEGGEVGWAKRHGYIRGWIRTDKEGKYAFYTLKPGAYPSRNNPEHIHAIILEPNGRYYYIYDYYFDGDTLLTEKDIHPIAPKGGTPGPLALKKEGDISVGARDIFLGKNVSGYND